MVALLFAGSAILLYSCERDTRTDDRGPDERMMTEYSENRTLVKSENGRKSYYFTTPLVEGYALAREPYREFRKGVKITTYKDDTTATVDGSLVADYAIYYEKQRLWEAKGNVVVENTNGTKVYTEQLFWNDRTHRIYSNVDTKLVDRSGNTTIGEGFESDDKLRLPVMRKVKGRGEFLVETERRDSSAAPRPPHPSAEPERTPAEDSRLTAAPVQPTSAASGPQADRPKSRVLRQRELKEEPLPLAAEEPQMPEQEPQKLP